MTENEPIDTGPEDRATDSEPEDRPSDTGADDRPTDAELEDHPVVLFDGVCNLCNRLVGFLIPRDPDGVFRFAPIQSPVGQRLLAGTGLPTDRVETVVLVEGGEQYTRSDAAIRIATRLGGPYRLLGPLRFVPRPLRDAVYDLVARHRYRIFGRRDRCMTPSPDVRSRFLATSGDDPASDDGSPGDESTGGDG